MAVPESPRPSSLPSQLRTSRHSQYPSPRCLANLSREQVCPDPPPRCPCYLLPALRNLWGGKGFLSLVHCLSLQSLAQTPGAQYIFWNERQVPYGDPMPPQRPLDSQGSVSSGCSAFQPRGVARAGPLCPGFGCDLQPEPRMVLLGDKLFREQNELRSMKSGGHANAGSRGLWKKSTGTDNVQEAQAPESCSTLGRRHGTLQRGQVTRARTYTQLNSAKLYQNRRVNARGDSPAEESSWEISKPTAEGNRQSRPSRPPQAPGWWK